MGECGGYHVPGVSPTFTATLDQSYGLFTSKQTGFMNILSSISHAYFIYFKKGRKARRVHLGR